MKLLYIAPFLHIWTKGMVKWETEPLAIPSNYWNRWEYSRWEFSGWEFSGWGGGSNSPERAWWVGNFRVWVFQWGIFQEPFYMVGNISHWWVKYHGCLRGSYICPCIIPTFNSDFNHTVIHYFQMRLFLSFNKLSNDYIVKVWFVVSLQKFV